MKQLVIFLFFLIFTKLNARNNKDSVSFFDATATATFPYEGKSYSLKLFIRSNLKDTTTISGKYLFLDVFTLMRVGDSIFYIQEMPYKDEFSRHKSEFKDFMGMPMPEIESLEQFFTLGNFSSDLKNSNETPKNDSLQAVYDKFSKDIYREFGIDSSHITQNINYTKSDSGDIRVDYSDYRLTNIALHLPFKRKIKLTRNQVSTDLTLEFHKISLNQPKAYFWIEK
ncbi:MAG: DUF4292 domain-containing protein [Chitinophagales bacterium]|jgi:hypothetical protein|nr:DUF4292 domain-containing protein [Chitinophagales bacterium]